MSYRSTARDRVRSARRVPPTTRVTVVPAVPDMDVRYGVGMTDAAEIDRAAWAALIAALVNAEAGGNQTKFANKVGATPRNVSRWLECEVAVKPESVTKVARALDRSPVELLVRVGYLSPQEVTGGGNEPLDPEVRRWVAILADPDVPAETKEAMRAQMRLWAGQVERMEQMRRERRNEHPEQAAG